MVNREIKFRAYGDYPLRMFPVRDIAFHNGKVSFVCDENGVEYVNDIPLMQYTGLKDSKGKGIYDGDILYYKDINDRELKCVVLWEHSGWGKKPHDYGHADIRARWDDYIIIGNIYENPELLEQ